MAPAKRPCTTEKRGWIIRFSSFEFVSDFVRRAPDLTARRISGSFARVFEDAEETETGGSP
jgi:hypothetical protein